MVGGADVGVPSMTKPYRVAVTIDVHKTDSTGDIDYCSEYLEAQAIRATFFVPTIMLAMSKYKQSIARLARSDHEIGTHSHIHCPDEIEALKSEDAGNIGFLEFSKKAFEDFFGHPPRSFRAPCWSTLSRRTLAELWRLGYWVDSTGTPQRLGLFSSYPTQNPYIFAKRRPRFIYRSLLEVPTSTLVFPLGSPTFETFRLRGSLVLLRLLLLEARIDKRIIITFMFHASDLRPRLLSLIRPPRRLTDLLPRTPGGFGFKHWVRETDCMKICRTAYGLLEKLRGSRFATLSQFYTEIVEASDIRDPT
jgi:hypothetical protein